MGDIFGQRAQIFTDLADRGAVSAAAGGGEFFGPAADQGKFVEHITKPCIDRGRAGGDHRGDGRRRFWGKVAASPSAAFERGYETEEGMIEREESEAFGRAGGITSEHQARGFGELVFHAFGEGGQSLTRQGPSRPGVERAARIPAGEGAAEHVFDDGGIVKCGAKLEKHLDITWRLDATRGAGAVDPEGGPVGASVVDRGEKLGLSFTGEPAPRVIGA